MKRLICVFWVMVLVFSLFACSQTKQPGMFIKPSELSEETKEVLEPFDNEIQFFDLSLDETAKYYEISGWVKQEGKWVEAGKTCGEVEPKSRRIAIRLTENSYDVYTMGDGGHMRYSYPELQTGFENAAALLDSKLSSETPIELDKEIAIWVKVGTEKSSMEALDTMEDFRNAECNSGVAITLTVSDKTLE